MIKNKILSILLALFILLIAASVFGLWYVNKVFIPVKLKSIVEQKLSENLNRKVRIERLNYVPFKGIIINNAAIYEQDEKTEFAKTKKIYFNILFLPLFRQKTIVIPSIKIDSLQINVIRDAKGQWNFSDLKKPQKQGPAQKRKLGFLIRRINLRNAQVSFQDKAVSPEFKTNLQNLNIQASVTLQKSIVFKADLLMRQSQDANITLNGVFSLSDKTLSTDIEADNIQLAEFSPYLNNLPIKILAGNFQIDSKIAFKIDAPKLLTYKGSAVIENLDANGIPYVDRLEKVKGKLFFSNDFIQSDSLTGICLGSPVLLKGKLENFSEPKVDILVEAEQIDLGVISQNLPESIKSKLKQIKMAGSAKINLALKGKLTDFENLKVEGKTTLSNASISQEKLPLPINDLSGEIFFEKNSAKITELSGSYGDTKYVLNATIKDFAKPDIDAVLRSTDLILSAKLSAADDLKGITISSLEGNFKNSPFKFAGEINDITDPHVNIYGNFQTDIDKIKNLNPKLSEFVEKFKPQGDISSEFALQGKVKSPVDWKLNLKASSSNFNIKGMNLGRVDAQITQQDGVIYLSKLVLNPYAGILNLAGQINLKEDKFPLALNMEISKVRIERLIEQTKLKNKDINGELSAQSALKGFAKDISSLEGQGWFQIKNGRLWEFPQMKMLSSILFTEPLEDVVFTSAGANFQIGDKKVSTGDLQLLSKDVTLTGIGNIGFDGGLDFLVSAEFSKKFAKEPELFGEIGSVIFETAKSLASQIKVTGTITNPKFTPVPVPPEKLFNKKILKPFEDIFKGAPQEKEETKNPEKPEGFEKFKEIFFPKDEE